MKSITMLVAVAALAACRSLSPVAAPLRVSNGEYRFNEHLDGRPDLEGTVSVRGDVIDVDTRNASCVVVPQSDSRVQAFRCGEYNIRADRLDGSWEFSYAMRRDVENRRTICDSYGTTPTGKTVCTSQHTEMSVSQVPVSGKIRLFALESASVTPQR